MRVLIIGGTGEGRVLAGRLALTPGLDVTTSLAGRVAEPRRPTGEVRVGGFGGADGLTEYLAGHVDAVVDATHPFATLITARAVVACERAGVPLLVVHRPGWAACDGDDWLRVPDVEAAASAVRQAVPGGEPVLLTLGRGGLPAFATDRDRHYVVRAVDPPAEEALPPRRTVVLGRGPFTLDAERALLREHGVRMLVTKDSGGSATAPKLVAAREFGVPVVMVDRPPLPDGVQTVTTVEDAQAWVLRISRSGRAAR